MSKEHKQVELEPKLKALLQVEMPRGEALLRQVRENDPRYGGVIRPLTKMYWTMNQQLGLVCQRLGYPLQQWKWSQSTPLEELAKEFPWIQATQWYQMHLNQMTMPTADHPWTKIVV